MIIGPKVFLSRDLSQVFEGYFKSMFEMIDNV